MTEYLTTEQVADMFQVPVATVRDWRYKETGPPAIRVGKYVRYPANAVEEWVEGLEVT